MLSSTSSPSTANSLLENIKLRRPYFILATSLSGRYFGKAVSAKQEERPGVILSRDSDNVLCSKYRDKAVPGYKKCYFILSISLSGRYFGRAVNARQEERPGVMLSRDSDSVLCSKY